jgi:hypothetical protein
MASMVATAFMIASGNQTARWTEWFDRMPVDHSVDFKQVTVLCPLSDAEFRSC